MSREAWAFALGRHSVSTGSGQIWNLVWAILDGDMIALLMGGSWPNTRTRPPDVVTIDDDDGMRIIFLVT